MTSMQHSEKKKSLTVHYDIDFIGQGTEDILRLGGFKPPHPRLDATLKVRGVRAFGNTMHSTRHLMSSVTQSSSRSVLECVFDMFYLVQRPCAGRAERPPLRQHMPHATP